MGNLTTLSQQGAENLERSLESLKEKDLRITKMQDAVTRRDSVTLALVTSLKGALVDINDSDIEVNVEKGVVLFQFRINYFLEVELHCNKSRQGSSRKGSQSY